MALFRAFMGQLHWGAFVRASTATTLFSLAVFVGSRGLEDFDAALIGYTMGTLFAVFGIAYRYSVWLTKPSTQKYWRRGIRLFFSKASWKSGWLPVFFTKAVVSRILVQDFIWRRGKLRYAAHFLIFWGCILAAAVTFPLVLGWVHFEQGAITPAPTYKVIAFGMTVQTLPLEGLLSWCVFHALIISSFLVIPGVFLAMYRRMTDAGEIAIQRFGMDLLPLLLLFLIAFSGLLLWIDYEWLEGYYYSVLAQFHAVTVIGTLIYLPFGKFFHIFQRPASLGVALYRELLMRERRASCPMTGEEFAPAAQTEDLREVLPSSGFDYSNATDGSRWQDISPRGKRILIGLAHSKIKNGAFY